MAFALFLAWLNRKFFDLVFKLLIVQTFFAFSTQIAGYISSQYYANNVVIFNTYLFADLWLVGAVAIAMLQHAMSRKLLMAGIIACTAIDSYCIAITGMNVFANWGYLSASILFTIVFLGLLIRLFMKGGSNTRLISQPYFWICTGTLIYYSCDVPLFGFLNYLIKFYPTVADKTYGVNDALTIIRYSFIGVAFVLQRRYSATTKALAA